MVKYIKVKVKSLLVLKFLKEVLCKGQSFKASSRGNLLTDLLKEKNCMIRIIIKKD